MKTIGLVGGMSWESTVEYYRILNEEVARRLGGLHSAEILMTSVDFGEVEPLLRAGRWEEIGERLAARARMLEAGGAGCVLLCTNTMHKVAHRIQAGLTVPFLHIADAAGEALRSKGVSLAGLLGTRATMEEDFYREVLQSRYGLEVLVPPEEERGRVHDVIFDELCRGIFKDESRAEYARIIQGLRERGAEGVVLGCTEIPLLVREEDVSVPLFDTTRLHALRAVDFALEEGASS